MESQRWGINRELDGGVWLGRRDCEARGGGAEGVAWWLRARAGMGVRVVLPGQG